MNNISSLAKTRRMVLVMNLLFFVVMILLFALGGYYGYSRFFEAAPLEYPSLPFDVVNREYHPEDKVALIVFRCNTTSESIIVNTTRNMLNVDTGERTVLAPGTVEVAPGCHKATYVVDAVPREAPPGTYILYGSAIVDGFLHQHVVAWSTRRFDVVR